MRARIKIEFTNNTGCNDSKLIYFLQETGSFFLSPYNNIDVITGQATIGWDIANTMPAKSSWNNNTV